jgi:hypothetical protein
MKSMQTIQVTLRVVLAAALAFSPATLPADEVYRLTATADASIREGSPSANNGSAQTLSVQSDTNHRIRALLKFDLTGLDPASAIKNSSLKLHQLNAPKTSRTHNLFVVAGTSEWNENVSWNSRDGVNLWLSAGGDFDTEAASNTNAGTNSNAQVSWQLRTAGKFSNVLQHWLNHPSQNRGLLILDAGSSYSFGKDQVQYGSRNHVFAAYRPVQDISLLRNVAPVSVTPGISEVTMHWTFPGGTNRSHYNDVTIVHSPGLTTPAFQPADGTSYIVGQWVGKAKLLLRKPVNQNLTVIFRCSA